MQLTDNRIVKANATWRRWAALGAGTFLAVVAPAWIVFGFLFVRPVVLLVIVGLSQGVLVGIALRWIWKRFGEVRWKGAGAAVAGLVSAWMVYGILYLREVWFVAQQGTRSWWNAVLAMVGLAKGSAYTLLDQFMLLPATGHSGFVGYVMYRIAESENFANMLVAHVAVCVLLSWRMGVYSRKARGAILASNSAA
jgi:hypothetical protein